MIILAGITGFFIITALVFVAYVWGYQDGCDSSWSEGFNAGVQATAHDPREW